MIVGGAATWVLVTTTLSSQRITVSPDADCMAGATVDNPVAAFCQARVIDKHTTEITRGKTYAELPKDDPKRTTAMNSAFLQSSLFTSVLAYGVSVMAAAMGLLFVLIGLGIRDVRTIRQPSGDPVGTTN
jgi:hypothetical protein